MIKLNKSVNRKLRLGSLVASAFLLHGALLNDVHAQAAAGYTEYFIPGDEFQIREILGDLDNDLRADQPGVAIIGVSAWADDTTLFYDHWEDGYEFDPLNPGNSADEIIQLRSTNDDPAIPTCTEEETIESFDAPICETTDPFHIFDSADIPRADRDALPDPLTNGCASAEAGNGFCYDGRDRIFVAGGATTMSRATWISGITGTGDDDNLDPGTFQALAWEVYPVRPQLTTYILPFGEDLFADEGFADFERVFALVQATADDTTVQIDFNNDGVFDLADFDRDGTCEASFVLPAGGSLLLDNATDGFAAAPDVACNPSPLGENAGLNTGTRIVGTETLQVQYVIGDDGSTYELRGFSAFPRGLWDTSYYAPVGSYTDDTDVFLHNPHATTLTVSYETGAGTGTIDVPAGETVSFEEETGAFLPDFSAAFFEAPEVFWGVSTIDTGGQIFDWGYALTPSRFLREEHRLGWAPTTSNTPLLDPLNTCPPGTNSEASGLFIAAAQGNTTLFVDLNDDGVFDETFSLDLLDSQFIEDNFNADLSNTRLYATGQFVGAWGQNPERSFGGDCSALDMGYTILPNSDILDAVLSLSKTSNPPLLALNASDTTEFTLTASTGDFDVRQLIFTDTLPGGFDYQENQTVITLPDGSTITGALAEPTSVTGTIAGGQTLVWNMNSLPNGSVLTGNGDLIENETVIITFTTQDTIGTRTDGEIAINEAETCGERVVGSGPSEVTQTFCSTDFEIVIFSNFENAIVKTSSVAEDVPLSPGDLFDYTVTVSNTGAGDLDQVTLFDPLPDEVTFVGPVSVVGTCDVPVFSTINVRDEFVTADSYTQNTGSDNWDAAWAEVNDFGGAGGGGIEVNGGSDGGQVANNAIRFDTEANAGDSISRTWTFPQTPSDQLTISFDFFETNVEGNDDIFVQYSDDDGASFLPLQALDGDSTEGNYSFTIPWDPADTEVVFRIFLEDELEGDDFFFFDNIDISFQAQTGTNSQAPAIEDPPNILRTEANCTLAQGNDLVFTIPVQVNDPLPVDTNEIINEASTNAAQLPIQKFDDARNIVINPSAQTAVVGDTVWIDFNDNGVKDIGEPGIAGVTVELKDFFGTPIRTATTDAAGRYLFTGVPIDRGYYVEVAAGIPAGLVQTDLTSPAPPLPKDRTPEFDLFNDASLGSNRDEFSGAPNGSNGSVAWSTSWVEAGDANGEINITGGQLELNSDNNGDNATITRTLSPPADVTNAVLTFDYDVDNPAGVEYEPEDEIFLEISSDGGSNFTILDAFSSGELDDDDNGNGPFSYSRDISNFLTASDTQIRFRVVEHNGGTEVFVVDNVDIAYTEATPILTFLDADLGYLPDMGSAIIGDRVWSDDDDNGVQDLGEPGIAGIEVQLYEDTNGDGVINDGATPVTTTTGVNGAYSFTVMIDTLGNPEPDYIILVDGGQTIDDPGGGTDTLSNIYSFTTTNEYAVPVFDGASFLTADVGLLQVATGTTFDITDRVWFDFDNDENDDDNPPAGSDGNGNDNAEAGIDGVTVELLNQSGFVVATTLTAADGTFSFNGVPGGQRYSWRITDQTGVLFTDYFGTTTPAQNRIYDMPTALTGDLDFTDEIDADGDGQTDPNFGFDITRSIGDTVYRDVSCVSPPANCGTQDAGEPGIAGVTVNLYSDANGDGQINGADAVVGTQLTDFFGNYLFSGLDPGDYIVSIDTPPVDLIYVEESDPDQGDATFDSDGNGDSDDNSAGQQRAVELVGDENIDTVDFGYRAESARDLAGRVWNDVNGDGVQDAPATEPGFENVTMALYADDGNDTFGPEDTLVATTTTNDTGNYAFNGVDQDETYHVLGTDQNGVLVGFEITFERTEGTSEPFNGQELIPDSVNDITDIDFGLRQLVTPLPITLASVHAQTTGGGLLVEWTTATETRNAGFHLYGRRFGEREWRQLTDEIVPSKVIDSLEPQRYAVKLNSAQIDELVVEDWSTTGKTQRHGPFRLNHPHGFDAVTHAKSIDWKSIRAENAKSMAKRDAERRAKGIAKGIAKGGVADALLWVETEGVHRVSFDALQAAGANFAGLLIDDLALVENGKRYARYVIDANDNGLFDSGDSVEFYGEAGDSLYSTSNAYRLMADASGDLVRDAQNRSVSARNAQDAAFADVVAAENNARYSFASPIDDPWYDAWIFARGGPATVARDFSLPGYAGGPAELTVNVYGVTDFPSPGDDHHLFINVNGVELSELRFDGTAVATTTITVPDGVLVEGTNFLDLVAPGDTGNPFDIMAYEGLEVSYARATEAFNGAWRGTFDQSGKFQVSGFSGDVVAWKGHRRRTGTDTLYLKGKGTWTAADESAILAPSIQADVPLASGAPLRGLVDYMIISHDLFIGSAALADIEALQQSRGYVTRVVDVDAIYAEYSDYERSADAISAFIKAARPRFVLLVGGDSTDYGDYLGLASQSFVPTHYVQTDDLVTFAPADSRFVDYNGDNRPSAAIGRLPVRTIAELDQVAAKILAYSPPTNSVQASGPSDSFREFAVINEQYAALLSPYVTTRSIFADDLGLNLAKSELTTELNDGGKLLSYVGHSSFAIWGLNPSHGIVFYADDARALTNSTPHLITQWGCWNTYFTDPRQDTMGSGFLFQANGAAA
ncbi:MAG: SdrD B-like domain-containing protein, partial [Pseudomonadota bacterium]